jgi:hypothetical protein
MRKLPSQIRGRIYEALLVFAGILVALSLWVFFEWFNGRHGEGNQNAIQVRVFDWEVAVFGLVIWPVVIYELIKFARVFTHGEPVFPPRWRDIAAIPVAFAGSLTIYLAFVFVANKIGLLHL